MWFLQLWLNAMFRSHMLSTAPTTFPDHLACFGLTVCTPTEILEEAFLEYLISFQSMTHIKTTFAPFALRKRGPNWFETPLLSFYQTSTLALWQKLFRPYCVIYYLKIHDIKAFVIHPSRQFGLSQCLPNKHLTTDNGYLTISRPYTTDVFEEVSSKIEGKLLKLRFVPFEPSFFKSWTYNTCILTNPTSL